MENTGIKLVKTIDLSGIKQIVIRVTNNESMIVFYCVDNIKINILVICRKYKKYK